MAEFVIGDYRYATSSSTSREVSVRVVNTTKTSYEDIPSSVTYEGVTYNVTSAESCFKDCTSLTTTPVIPNSVTRMVDCFRNCTSLTTAPITLNGVTIMANCFRNCTSLTQAPVIPDSVTNMSYCFYNCTSLTQTPIIPSSVEYMNYCFSGCTSLTGDVYMLGTGTPPTYGYMFANTVLPITLHTYYPTATGLNIANTANNRNVTLGDKVGITMLDSKFVESKKYRVDMLLDCRTSGCITRMLPAGILYDMDDNVMELGVDIDFVPQFIRCYAIFFNENQVPENKNITITIENVNPYFAQASIGRPTTATPSVIRQEGQSTPISPTIHVNNVMFNHKTTGLDFDTVGGCISMTMGSTAGAEESINVQTNVGNDANDVKHIVTHASNVRINDTTTLQDWITEQYNNLT